MRVESKWTCYEAADDGGTTCERFARLSCGCSVPLVQDLEMEPDLPCPLHEESRFMGHPPAVGETQLY
jgi:hypothetical protein